MGLLRPHFLLPPNDAYLAFCSDYHALCSTWNLAAKLLSKSDLEERFDEHVADSLGLLPYFCKAEELGVSTYMDIGSGGGFPALPLLGAGVRLRTVLIERSQRKAEFLRLNLQRLKLSCAAVVEKSYPRCELPDSATVLTARATENPVEVDAEIVRRLKPSDVYLAQRTVEPEPAGVIRRPIEDAFDRLGLRRSRLFLVGYPTLIERFHVEPQRP